MKIPNDIPPPCLPSVIVYCVNSVHCLPANNKDPPLSELIKGVYIRLAKPSTTWDFRVSVHIHPRSIVAARQNDMSSGIAVSSFKHYVVRNETAMIQKCRIWSRGVCVPSGNNIEILHQLPLRSDSVELTLWRPDVDQTTEFVMVV